MNCEVGFKKALPLACLSVVMFFSGNAYCQEAKDVIPSGTTGEELEVVDSSKVKTKWRDRRWRLFPGKYSTLKLGGGFLYEYAGYIQDENSRRQMDSLGTKLDPTFAVRDFRIVAGGQFKTKRSFSWKAGFMYDGTTDTWLVRETGLMFGVPELWGNIFIGRTKEGFSLNKVMNGYAGWTMERQMAIDVIPILADGVKWLGYLPKQRVLWNLGMFADWLSKGQSFSTYKWQWVARVGWLPIYSPESKTVLHVGINYRYGEPESGSIQVRSRPEANPAPRFIDTGEFQSNYSNHYGGEIYYRTGSWLFGTEFYSHRFNSLSAGDPVFVGGDVVASYVLTGESRPYQTSTG